MASMDRYKRRWNPSTRLWVYEHREVAARMLRRNLRADEVVHHSDGDWLNNLPSNLIVMSRSAHMALHMRKDTTCSICPKKHHAKGFCKTHYTAQVRRERGRVW